MSFDWIDFFDRHGIEYRADSPNAGRGEVAVKCPFCGPADPSQHMSINLEGNGWVCRRARHDSTHRGRSPIRLVRALTGCSAREAARIVGVPQLPGTQSVLDQVEALVGADDPNGDASPPPSLAEPREFKKFVGKPSQRPYLNYLERRGFPEEFVQRASREMGLRYCTLGTFGGRVIFLVEQEGCLVNWTGRAVSSRATRRYHAHTPDPELAERWGLPPASRSIEGCLLWYDELLAGGEHLVVVEGPMDALKLRMLLGHPVTCLFTNVVSRGQLDLLRVLSPRFERRSLLLDKGAEMNAVSAASQLSALHFGIGWLPNEVDDPGELTHTLLRKIRY